MAHSDTPVLHFTGRTCGRIGVGYSKPNKQAYGGCRGGPSLGVLVGPEIVHIVQKIKFFDFFQNETSELLITWSETW